jgi:hypothetical protein
MHYSPVYCTKQWSRRYQTWILLEPEVSLLSRIKLVFQLNDCCLGIQILDDLGKNADVENLYEECLSCFDKLYISLKGAQKHEATNIGYSRSASVALIEEERSRFIIWKTRAHRFVFEQDSSLGRTRFQVVKRVLRMLMDLRTSLSKGTGHIDP